MKLLRRKIDFSARSGFVILLPEDSEDMWHAYNLIHVDDTIHASTVRRIKSKNSQTGSSTSSRVNTKLAVKVTSMDFDVASSHLRVAGKVCEANEHVSLGSYHTLDLALHKPFTLTKTSGTWDSFTLQTLNEATDGSRKAQAWFILMREGFANICLVTEYRTVLKLRIDQPLPKKRSTTRSSDYDTALQRFHSSLLSSLLRNIESTLSSTSQSYTVSPTSLPPLVIASPGFAANNFLKYACQIASSSSTNTSLCIPGKILASYLKSVQVIHCANLSIANISSLLANPQLSKSLELTRTANDAAFLDRFNQCLREEAIAEHSTYYGDNISNSTNFAPRAWYGRTPALNASRRGLISHGTTILLNDCLFRFDTPSTQNRVGKEPLSPKQVLAEHTKWVKLVDSARSSGADVRIVSYIHDVGRRLNAIGDVALLLAWGVADLDQPPLT